ncbi:unnamed protein product, partial [marine sediment metagenome]
GLNSPLYDLGATEQAQFGVDLTIGQGGGEFANKRHDEKTLRNWNWRTFSEANKTAYKAMVTAIGGIYAKVLWYDGSRFNSFICTIVKTIFHS